MKLMKYFDEKLTEGSKMDKSIIIFITRTISIKNPHILVTKKNENAFRFVK